MAHLVRCLIYPLNVSGMSPAARTLFKYRDSYPLAWISMLVWISSVMVVGLEPTDFHERPTPEETRTPGEESAIVRVTAGLKNPKKQRLLVFQFCFET